MKTISEFETKAGRAVISPVLFLDAGAAHGPLVQHFLEKAGSRHVIIADSPEIIEKISKTFREKAHLVEISALSSHRLSLRLTTMPKRR